MELLFGNVSRLSADIFLTIWPASTWHGCVLSISVQRSSSDCRLAENHQWVARSPWLISNHRNHRYLSPFLSLFLSLSVCLSVSQAWISPLCAFFSWIDPPRSMFSILFSSSRRRNSTCAISSPLRIPKLGSSQVGWRLPPIDPLCSSFRYLVFVASWTILYSFPFAAFFTSTLVFSPRRLAFANYFHK